MLNKNKIELILVPAYGRRYLNKEDMVKGWTSGKDFRVVAGPYCSIRDINYLKTTASRVTITQDHFNYIVI